MNVNLPNKITVARICLIPLFLIVMFVPFGWGNVEVGSMSIPVAHLVGAIIFIVASSTDWIDGHLARKYNLVTNLEIGRASCRERVNMSVGVESESKKISME